MCKVLDQLNLINGTKLTDKQAKNIFRGIGEDLVENFQEHKDMQKDIHEIKDDVKIIKDIVTSKWLKYAIGGTVLIIMLSGIGLAYFIAPHIINSQNAPEIVNKAFWYSLKKG